jgi:hypothetical protein
MSYTATAPTKARYWIHGPRASGKSILANRIAGPEAITVSVRPILTFTSIQRLLSEQKSLIIDDFVDNQKLRVALLQAITCTSITKGIVGSSKTQKIEFNIKTLIIISERPPRDQAFADRFHIIKLKAPAKFY